MPSGYKQHGSSGYGIKPRYAPPKHVTNKVGNPYLDKDRRAQVDKTPKKEQKQ